MKRPVKRHEVQQPLDASYRLIPLTQNKNAIVDTADFVWLTQWNWYAGWAEHTQSFYAMRRPSIRMHRQILGCTAIEEGDHKNGDTLDNQRHNLRKCTQPQNARNQRKPRNNASGYKGVCWCKALKKWQGHICFNGRKRHLGFFSNKEEAARAYDEAAKIYHKEFAQLNFPSTDTKQLNPLPPLS